MYHVCDTPHHRYRCIDMSFENLWGPVQTFGWICLFAFLRKNNPRSKPLCPSLWKSASMPPQYLPLNRHSFQMILKDHQHHLTNDTDPRASSPLSTLVVSPFGSRLIRFAKVPPITSIYNMISNPMDFKTMSIKLEMGQYPNREACKDDVNLIFNNCNTHNLPDSSLVCQNWVPKKNSQRRRNPI